PSRVSQHEQESSQRKVLQRTVLRYLSVNGPSEWSEIYTHVEQQNNGASITDALRCLASVDSITIAIGGRAAITASGVAQLQRLE
ncbi:MAG TPA: hypothetical protein VE177_04540, partial [Candidatus Binatus sp.]|nr:hypothetical protein [Candidatus Binatus sp.]